MKKILQKDSPILRQKSLEVPVKDISSPKIKKVIREMKEALNSQDDGVAIAAPQIGYSLRIFIVSKKVFEINKAVKENPRGISSTGLVLFISKTFFETIN